MRVLVVVLNYKGCDDTVKCLESLKQQSFTDFQIYLVDNNSADGSVETLTPIAEQDTQIIFDTQDINTGFTGGVNLGIKYAMAHDFEYVALLNNDAQASPEWLERLVTAADDTQAGITTCLLLSEDGKKIDDAGAIYTMWGSSELRAEGYPVSKAPESGYVFGATGGASLYRLSMLREIGLFDEKFFAYSEDIDISWRVQLAGYRVYYEKSAVAYHKHSATSGKIPGFTTKQVFQNIPLVFYKNVPAGMFFSIGIRLSVSYAAFFLLKIVQGAFMPACKGAFLSLCLTPYALRHRVKIQRDKKVDNEYLRSIISKNLSAKNLARVKRIFGKNAPAQDNSVK